MSTALPQKRAAAARERRPGTSSEGMSGTAAATSTRYDRLLSILSKSLSRSRDEIASDAPRSIEECYGEMTSLFTSSDDADGVTRLVDILLGKLDGANDRLGPDLRRSSSASTTSSGTVKFSPSCILLRGPNTTDTCMSYRRQRSPSRTNLPHCRPACWRPGHLVNM